MDIEISDAILIGIPDGTNYWVLKTEITNDDGSFYPMWYRFPEDIFEHRAAEHGIMDKDKLLEFILYERHIEGLSLKEAIDTKLMLTKIKAKKGKGKIKTRHRHDHESPVALGVVLVDAKQHQLTPLETLKKEMLLDLEHIKVKKIIHEMRVNNLTIGDVDYRKRPNPEEILAQVLKRPKDNNGET